jgi:hypothetical protein
MSLHQTTVFRPIPKVYRKPEEWKIGWVHGFYSCGFVDNSLDDGAPCESYRTSVGDVRLYWLGYAAGRAARRGI